jgi:hypothetical protein
MIRPLFLQRCFLFVWLTCLGAGCAGFQIPWLDTAPKRAEYGQRVRFGIGQQLHFPDFTLTYVGERHVASEVFPRGFTYHDFKITHGEEEAQVSWSSGTGEIGPVFFEVEGEEYQLELRYSDKLGQLAENQLVIWDDE